MSNTGRIECTTKKDCEATKLDEMANALENLQAAVSHLRDTSKVIIDGEIPSVDSQSENTSYTIASMMASFPSELGELSKQIRAECANIKEALY